MNFYYIQFTTDFHLLTALAYVDDISSSNITLVGPKTKMVSMLSSKLVVEHYHVDPRSPKISYQEVLRNFINAKSSKEHIIISPFAFPLFSYLYLLKKGVKVRKIVRTDEGVGTYASIRHYYNAYRLEVADSSILQCFLRSVLKKLTMNLTVLFGLCETRYIFDKSLTINRQQIDNINRNIQIIGKLDELEGEVVYVSQPNVEKNFASLEDYGAFIREVGRSFGSDNVVVKKHPSDNFDYILNGFRVLEGLPLEIYNVKDSNIFGFSSTALLTAKIIGGCTQVYYLKLSGGVLTYDCLSDFNNQLFKLYLTPLDYLSKDIKDR
jgi:DNA-directed RNA polymerase subunit H (RpoH/RPB5)